MMRRDIIRLMGIKIIEKTNEANILRGPVPQDVLGKELKKSRSKKPLNPTERGVIHAYAAKDYQHAAIRAYDLIERASHLSPTDPDRRDYLYTAQRLLKRLDTDLTIARQAIPSQSISTMRTYDQLRTQAFELHRLWQCETEFPGIGKYMAGLAGEFEEAKSNRDWIGAAVVQDQMNQYNLETALE